MKNYLSVIITHGELAAELDRVAQKFLPTEFPVFTYSNQKQAIESIVSDVELQIKQLNPERIIVFVDLIGGSCWHAAMSIKKNQQNCALVTGINIPVLVSFATNYERMEWQELLEKIEQDAKKAIRVVK